MGGYGSGIRYKKPTVENCLSIDIRQWNRQGLITKGLKFVWRWMDKDKAPMASIRVDVKNKNEINLVYSLEGINEGKVQQYKLYITLSWTKCNYGGGRVWFICPKCGNRVAKLYLKTDIFSCRECNDLNYRSSQISGNVVRILDYKISKIKEKLRDNKRHENLTIQKPKGMHYSTYFKLLKKLRKLENKRMKTLIKRIDI